MGQNISEQDVRHAASLSRLKLTDAQVRHFTERLGGILDYIAKLNELDVEGVEPMAHPTDIVNRFREDQVTDSLPTDVALHNAPATDPPFFKVPKVLGDGPGA
jgi:aspartyl-tRNA(Asn)/glutamyl-tRNA(Gln) amidotransferase subunit C